MLEMLLDWERLVGNVDVVVEVNAVVEPCRDGNHRLVPVVELGEITVGRVKFDERDE